MKSLADDVVVTCDEIVKTPETRSIKPNDKTSYCFIAEVSLAITCLLLLVAIVVKFSMKR